MLKHYIVSTESFLVLMPENMTVLFALTSEASLLFHQKSIRIWLGKTQNVREKNH